MEFLYILADIRNGFFDLLFGFFSCFGEEMAALALLCVLYWCIDKRLAYRIALSFFASGMLVQTLKITFRIDRPWVLDPNFRPVPTALETATGYSFPSGHTQCASSLFSTLALSLKPIWFKIVCGVIIAGVGMSRMYLGVHTPVDVVTSMVLSIALSVICCRLLSKYETDTSKDGIIALVLGGISAAVTVYAFIVMAQHPEGREDILSCVKAGGAGLGFSVAFFAERRFIRFDTKSAVPMQIVKFIAGVAGALIIKEGMKLIGQYAAVDFIRYMLLTLWAIAVFPYLFSRVGKRKGQSK